LFFSPLGGKLAKTRKKSEVMFWSKVAELPLFIIAILGMYLHSIYLVLFVVFMIGTTSALFSPSKYGLIRDIGGDEGVSYGTGTLEMLTFLGVLLGTLFASIVADFYNHFIFAAFVLSISLIQIYFSWKLKNIPEEKTEIANNETLNPIKFLLKSYRMGKSIPKMNLIILGLSTFWMIGNFILMNLLVHCEKVLNMNNSQTGIIMTISAVGIGLGSFITGLLSKQKITLGYSTLGALGMVICFILLFILRPSGILFSILILLTSFFCGMYMVPLSAWVQSCVKGRLQGDVLAYSNFLIFLFNLISALIFGPLVQNFDTYAVWLLLILIISSISTIMILNIKEMRFIKNN
jgi:acyl-[acyl-carrier-protein]-phospholipid O-acyltransferase/long-chain-fatty-acid--[acyl-carrier-protein] ligase